MLSKVMLLKMFEHNHHINTRLLELAAKVTPEQWRAPYEEGHRSLHETLFHFLTVEEEWVSFCEHGTPNFAYRRIEDYPDAASLSAFSDQNYKMICAYLESVTEEILISSVFGKMPAPDSRERSIVIWYALTHVLYHSAQHRSEVAMMLTRYGQSPSFIDFMGFDW